MEKKKKDFDAVEWVRGVRDANYKRLGHLPTKEYFRRLGEEGEKSSLAKELKANADRAKNKHKS